MRYEILYEPTPEKLSKSVQEKLNQGWELAGGVAAMGFSGEEGEIWEYSQAMVLREGPAQPTRAMRDAAF